MSGQVAPSGSGPVARLLLADGDPGLRRALRRALQARGYQVTLVGTATAALELAGHEQPDLVVLDLTLPRVVDAVRALRHAGATPILLLTWPTEPDPQAALDAGADDALTKPFGIGQLLDRLQALRTPAPLPPHHGRQHATGADPPWTPS